MAAVAYYVTAIYTCTQVRESPGRAGPRDSIQIWDAGFSQIVFAQSPDEAQSLFEAALREQPEGENPREIVIRKIAVAPVVDQLLTETGNLPLDWPKIRDQEESGVPSTPMDDFEQGYWVDADQVVRPDKLSFSIGTIQSDVPEDVGSGLNWSDKQFFFLLNVLPLPAPPLSPDNEPEGETADSEEEGSNEPSPSEIEAMNVIFPETVALIQARNSVVAAWLWRRYAATTRLNANAIRIVPPCGTVGQPEC